MDDIYRSIFLVFIIHRFEIFQFIILCEINFGENPDVLTG